MSIRRSGQKIEFSELRTISVARPDRLRIDVDESSGDRQMLLFDGKELTVAKQAARTHPVKPA